VTTVLVTGATGVVGPFVVRRLLEAGHDVRAVTRSPPPGAESPGLTWERLDLTKVLHLAPPAPEALIHAAPLWLLPPVLGILAQAGIRRVVAFSSASRFSKEQSRSRPERELAQRLSVAETRLAEEAARHEVAWTLFRPTLIYGEGRDRNVSDIARFARRFGVVPVAGQACGRRQPVHADDLAQASVRALGLAVTHGRSYDLAGGETLTYREMALRVATAVRPGARVVSLSPAVLRLALSALSLAPGFRHVTAGMADRMNEDLMVDDSSARADISWAPRPLHERSVGDNPA
jgi:nucleoside-diphosphate-sugar epimerase